MNAKTVTAMKPKSTDLPVEEQIRIRAQELFDSRKPEDANAIDDWLQAEKEILSQNKAKSATASST